MTKKIGDKQIGDKKIGAKKKLFGNRVSLADIAIFPFVRQFAHVDYGWFSSNYNSLKIWLETIASSGFIKEP